MIRTHIFIVALFSLFVIAMPAQRNETGIPSGSGLVLATADTPPYSTDDGMGIYDRLLRNAFETLNITITIRHLPSERGLLEADQGRIDGEFARTAQVVAGYKNLIQVPEPLSIWDFVAVTRSGTPVPSTFSALRDFHVAFVNGWKIFESNVTHFRSLTLVESEEQLFAMLMAERVDVILYARRRAEDWINRHHTNSLVISSDALARQPMYLLLHRRHAELVPRLSMALRHVREADHYNGERHVPGIGAIR